MAAILGSEAFAVTVEGSPFNSILAASLNNFAIDFDVTTSGFYLTGDRPYNYAAPLGLNAPITDNLPTTVTTFSINADHIAKSFLYDWYFRIHITYTTLALGNIVSDQYINIEVWNSYFIDNTLSVITGSGIADIILTFPVTLPHVFSPLEYIIVEAHVLAKGTPTIDGYYDFPFTTDTVRMYVTGQRVILWPFIPRKEFTEEKLFLTDVIKVRDGESRYALRDKARRTLKYSYFFRDIKEYAFAKEFGEASAHIALATPLYTDLVKLTNLSAGTYTINFDTTNLELEAGSIVVFIKDYDNYELQEILSLTPTSITLKNPLANSWYICYLFPVYIGYPGRSISLTREQNNKLSGEVAFNIVDNFYDASWTPAEIYLSLPVMTDADIISGGKYDNYARELETFDSEVGDIIKFSSENYTRTEKSIHLRAKTKAELYDLRRRFDYLKGMYQAFWVSSKMNDLVALSDITIGGNTLTVTKASWSDYNLHHIRISGTNIINVEVTDAIDNLNGTETLTFSPVASVDVFSITKIEILTKVRLASDNVSFSHSNSGVTYVKANVLEVLA